MPLLVDHLAFAFIVLVIPVYSALEHRRLKARFEAGEPFDRIAMYRTTMLMQWSVLAILIGGWWWLERPWSDLGLAVPSGTGFFISLALGAGITVFLLWQIFQVRGLDEATRQETREGLGFIGEILPHSDQDLRHFYGVSITAGIVEEVVFRAFAIVYLMTWLNPILAVIIASLVFGLGHAYQGKAGILKTGIAGLVLGGLYVASGTLWVPIVVHILADALQGIMVRELRRPGPTTASPAAA